MPKFWQWAAGAIAALTIAAILVIVLFDWNWLKGPLESRLSSLTGKQVHIDGPVTGEWSWVSHIDLERIRIEDPDFRSATKIATVDRIGFAIDLRELLGGRLEFPEIRIVHPVLDLARGPDGKANWDIAADAKGPGDRGSMPVIGVLRIDNGKVTYRDPAKRVTIDATIATVSANGGSGEGSVTLEGHGTYRDAPFTLRLKGGSLNDLRKTKKPYNLDLTAAVGATKIAIAGTVVDPFQMTGMNVKLTAEGDNAEQLYPIFGIPAPPTPPYRLAGTLDKQETTWLFQNFAGTVGKSDLAGSLKFEPNRPRLLVSGNLVSKNLDFADLGLLVGAPGSIAPGRPVSDVQRRLAQQVEQSGRVLPDAPLNLSEVRNVDADIAFKGEHLEMQTLPLESLDLHVKLDNAILSLAPLHVGVAGGHADGTIVINARNDEVVTDYDVRLSRFQADQFFQRAGFPGGGSGVLDGRIRLHGIGNSVRRSLGNSDGEASAVVDHGTLSNLASDILGLDVAHALGLIITGNDKQIPLNCLVMDFQVEKGEMRPRIAILDTSATLVTATGTVSLKDERLDLSLNGKPKQASVLNLGGPIEVGGTFKKPSAGLGTETILRGGAAVALGAILTPLAAVLGFIDAGQGEGADCANLERTAQTNTAKQPPVRTRQSGRSR